MASITLWAHMASNSHTGCIWDPLFFSAFSRLLPLWFNVYEAVLDGE